MLCARVSKGRREQSVRRVGRNIMLADDDGRRR